MNNKVNILGCSFTSLSFKETVDWVNALIVSGKKGYICTVNVAILMMMRSDPLLNDIVQRSSFVVPDGQPILWASLYQPVHLKERITGMDLMCALCELSAKKGYRVGFLGSRRETMEKAVAILKERYPGLTVSFTSDGYFSSDEEAEKAELIRTSRPQILFVAMGAPKQEVFIDKFLPGLDVNFMLPVGGALEIITGNLKRAPVWMQKCGLEWFYRLLQEPKRLWRRYLFTNTLFIFLVFSDIIKKTFNRSNCS